MNNYIINLIRVLNLQPLPVEGGYYSETFQSEATLAHPEPPHPTRKLYSAIYYLLTPETQSALHKLRSDEIFHFYLGDPVEMVLINESYTVQEITLGHDILNQQHVQFRVPKNVWQGAKLAEGGQFALLGTTMSPGYDNMDYEHGNAAELKQHLGKDWKQVEPFVKLPT